jgi:hypothetical protein
LALKVRKIFESRRASIKRATQYSSVVRKIFFQGFRFGGKKVNEPNVLTAFFSVSHGDNLAFGFDFLDNVEWTHYLGFECACYP